MEYARRLRGMDGVSDSVAGVLATALGFFGFFGVTLATCGFFAASFLLGVGCGFGAGFVAVEALVDEDELVTLLELDDGSDSVEDETSDGVEVLVVSLVVS